VPSAGGRQASAAGRRLAASAAAFISFRVARRGTIVTICQSSPATTRKRSRQRNSFRFLRIIDLEPRNIDIDRFRDVLGSSNHFDRVGGRYLTVPAGPAAL